jgi:HNH endonuclease.
MTKSHCPAGHPYAGRNLVRFRDGVRRCRQCRHDSNQRRWRRRHPEPKPRGRPRLQYPKARRMVFQPQHPLANASGYAMESRLALFAKIGSGPHPCHWCGEWVQWRVTKRGRPTRGSLMTDHVNGNEHDNVPENLVPACQSCNGTRERRIGPHDLFLIRPNGKRLRAVSKMCERCGKAFLTAPSNIRGNHGRFCSRSCARSGKRKRH